MMAQTGSAQREPSMEEILASIRRIIEDSDTARKPHEDAELPQFSHSGAMAETMPDAMPDMMAAVDRREIEVFEAELREPAPLLPPLPSLPRAPEVSEARWPAENPAMESLPESHARTMDASPQPAEPEFAPQASAGDAPAHAGEGRAVLMSDRAGRQVAAAFGELSEAFATSRRRSFDEMAEEMLRPMLQDWLDNNLPTLVERLVREEIERVARGG